MEVVVVPDDGEDVEVVLAPEDGEEAPFLRLRVVLPQRPEEVVLVRVTRVDGTEREMVVLE